MHYIDVGKGDTILFLHGQPTSSYLWRNIIPHLQTNARCIAPDLIGMGKSDKPDISYTFEDHYDYLKKFIEKLNLENITFVIHDWGSGLGFHYANEHQNNIKGIAFMEAIIKPMTWTDFPTEYKVIFKLIRSPFIGWLMLSVANMFLNKRWIAEKGMPYCKIGRDLLFHKEHCDKWVIEFRKCNKNSL